MISEKYMNVCCWRYLSIALFESLQNKISLKQFPIKILKRSVKIFENSLLPFSTKILTCDD